MSRHATISPPLVPVERNRMPVGRRFHATARCIEGQRRQVSISKPTSEGSLRQCPRRNSLGMLHASVGCAFERYVGENSIGVSASSVAVRSNKPCFGNVRLFLGYIPIMWYKIFSLFIYGERMPPRFHVGGRYAMTETFRVPSNNTAMFFAIFPSPSPHPPRFRTKFG